MSACTHCGYSDPGGWRECPACGQYAPPTSGAVGGYAPSDATPPPGYGPGNPPPGYGAAPHGASGPANPYAAPSSPAAPPVAYAYHYSQPALLRTSGKAIASMVMGIVSLVFYPLGFILGPLAIAFWATSRADFRGMPPAYKGNGMAIAGLVTGIVGSLLGLLFLGIIITAACAASRTHGGPGY